MSSGSLVAIIVGVGIAAQVAVLGRSTGATNPLAASFALQIAGVVAATAWATQRGAWSEVVSVSHHWWWIPLGVGGWVLVAALGFASSRIGVASTLALSIAAQLVTAVGFDTATGTSQIGLRPVLGVAMMLFGSFMVNSV
jgi:transporter family-2 protein